MARDDQSRADQTCSIEIWDGQSRRRAPINSSNAAKISMPRVMAMPPTRNGGRCRFGGVGHDTDRHTGLSGGIQHEIRKEEKLKARGINSRRHAGIYSLDTNMP